MLVSLSSPLLFLLASLLLASISTSVTALSLPNSKRATVCNGSANLCNRSYGNITFAGAHDSYAIGSTLASNQNVSITTQLNAGIRLLQAQAHGSTNTTPSGAGIDLCHTSCSLFQGGALEYWLGQIKSWTDANPNEVVTLLIVNSDGLPPSQFAQAFVSTGLSSKMYSPPSATTAKTRWPTLGTLIDSGKTVVAFMTPGASFSSVPYLIDEFSNIWENPYNQVTTPFNCSVDRIGAGVTNPSGLMYVSNQFLDSSILDGSIVIPNTGALNTTNSVSGTLTTSQACAALHGSYPNFILTDFSTLPNYGLMRAVAQMNGVNYQAPASITASSGGSSSSGSSGGSNSGSNSGSSGASSLSPLVAPALAAGAGLVALLL